MRGWLFSCLTWSLERSHNIYLLLISVVNVIDVFTTPTVSNQCGPLVCGIVEGTAKEELCVKCFNANQNKNTLKDELEKEQQQQQPSV